MNLNHVHILIVVGLAVVIFYIYFYSKSNNQNYEHFAEKCPRTSILDTSISSLSEFPNIQCLIDVNNIECKLNETGAIAYNKLFPIHIIRTTDTPSKFLAVFNDGNLYVNDNIEKENLWRGPLPNSSPKSGVLLWNITYTREGFLLGIGNDYHLYIKSTQNIESPWKNSPVPNSDCMMYVIYDNKDNRLMGLGLNGMIYKKTEEDITSEWEITDGTDKPMLKLYWDLNGHLMGIGTDFKLYQKDIVGWEVGKWKSKTSEDMLFDIIYDNDGRLYGMVINTIAGIYELMKQNRAYYTAQFFPLEDNDPPGSDIMVSSQIIKTKMGGDFISYLDRKEDETDEIIDPSLEEIRQEYILQSQAKLRALCAAKKKAQDKGKYYDFDLQRKIEEQDQLINNLKKELNEYTKLDPKYLKLQDQQIQFTDIIDITKS